MAYFKSAAMPVFNNSGNVGPIKLKFKIWIGDQICTVTQKSVAYFKSAAMPFFYKSGTVGPRKLKFGLWVGNQICIIVLQLRRVWHTSKVLPCTFSITLALLVLES